MLKIESIHTNINKSNREIFDFLSDMNNYIHILPNDKISDWKSEINSCFFKVKGFGIELIMKEKAEFENIKIISGDKSPIKFDLDIYIKEINNNKASEAYLICDSNVNNVVKMMIEKPLSSLFDYMTIELKKKMEQNI